MAIEEGKAPQLSLAIDFSGPFMFRWELGGSRGLMRSTEWEMWPELEHRLFSSLLPGKSALLPEPFSQQITELQARLPCGLVFEDCSIFSSLAWCQAHNKCVFVTTWVGSLLEYRTESLPYITGCFFLSFNKCSFIKLLRGEEPSYFCLCAC